MSTKRPQNRCGKCGYTWHPRGKDISLRCPSCGNTKVSKVGAGSLIGTIAFLAFMSLGDGKKPTEVKETEKQASTKTVQQSSDNNYSASTTNQAAPEFKRQDLSVWTTQPTSESVPAPKPTSNTDCSNHKVRFLRITCENSSVAEADLRMRAAFERAVTVASEPAAIRVEQHRWEIAVRDKCMDADCLLQSYQDREAALDGNQ